MSHQFWIQVYSEKSWKNFLRQRSFYKYNVLEYILDNNDEYKLVGFVFKTNIKNQLKIWMDLMYLKFYFPNSDKCSHYHSTIFQNYSMYQIPLITK